MNNPTARKAAVTGHGEVIKKDGTVIPIVLTAETELSIDEVRERTGLPVTEVAEEAQEE